MQSYPIHQKFVNIVATSFVSRFAFLYTALLASCSRTFTQWYYLYKLIYTIFFLFLSFCCYAEDKFIIQGEYEPKISDVIEIKMKELKEQNEKIKSDIILLQDKIISKNKDHVNLNISIETENKINSPNYGIVQLMGTMNNTSIIRYDTPILLEKKENFPLFDGLLPLGKYKFKLNVVVGQQTAKWPFVLPEGKWDLEEEIEVDTNKEGKQKKITFVVKAEKETGVPVLEIETEKK
jgi:hypothetical protein